MLDLLPDRIANKIEPEPNTGCWLWTGALQAPSKKSIGGYGVCGVGIHVRFVHRLTYELLRGTIPDGLQIDHLCRVRSCVNPDHMEVVTGRINVLRGTSVSARHAKRTHCRRGHPLDRITLRNSGRRQRYCGTCACYAARAFYWNKKLYA